MLCSARHVVNSADWAFGCEGGEAGGEAKRDGCRRGRDAGRCGQESADGRSIVVVVVVVVVRWRG